MGARLSGARLKTFCFKNNSIHAAVHILFAVHEISLLIYQQQIGEEKQNTDK
jgi:hypothetical protein